MKCWCRGTSTVYSTQIGINCIFWHLCSANGWLEEKKHHHCYRCVWDILLLFERKGQQGTHTLDQEVERQELFFPSWVHISGDYCSFRTAFTPFDTSAIHSFPIKAFSSIWLFGGPQASPLPFPAAPPPVSLRPVLPPSYRDLRQEVYHLLCTRSRR